MIIGGFVVLLVGEYAKGIIYIIIGAVFTWGFKSRTIKRFLKRR